MVLVFKKLFPALKMFIYSAITLMAAFSIAWLLLMKADFFYGVWHDIGGIREGIEKYGPQNRFKRGFEDTTREQRKQLFAQINHAVHHAGKGLTSIQYETPTSHGPRLLLRKAEVVHLQDVAHLIQVLKPIPFISLFAWWVWWLLSVYKKWRTPTLKNQVLALTGLLGGVFIVLLLIGPENVFNTLHIWIFPKDHQWFFYYQESLMSTMMLAPVLFGWIAAALVIVALLLYIGLNLLFEHAGRLARRQIDRAAKLNAAKSRG